MNARDERMFNRTQTLLRGLYSSGLCVMYQDAALGMHLIENPPPCFPSQAEIFGGGDAAIFGDTVASDVRAAKEGVLRSGEPVRIDARMRDAREEVWWFRLHIEPDFEEASYAGASKGAAPRVRGLFVSITDITQLKRREEVLRSLLYEVSHRSRNLLAIVQSILGHTARHSDSIASFERKYRGRIASLAHSQDLVTTSNWQGVPFRELVESQLSEYLHADRPHPVVEGDDPVLSPNTVLHVGLALHELAMNSASFGAMSGGGGAIAISIGSSRSRQRLTWAETLAEPREVGRYRGFGQAILEQVVARAIDGRARYEIMPQRIAYSLDWPESAPV